MNTTTQTAGQPRQPRMIFQPQKATKLPRPDGADAKHRLELEALEHAIHHETTQHAPKLHEQKVKATPLDARSKQRRFPR
jgi:hypothetical protein